MMRLPENSLIICAGVSGCGKSTLARHLAEAFEASFFEADDFHPTENIKHMAAGKPLSDAMRAPWMMKLCIHIEAAETAVILACSALKQSHRDQFRATGRQTIFIHLYGPFELISERMKARKEHFMPANLLQSQFEALDTMADETDAIVIDIAKSKHEVFKEASEHVRQTYGLVEI